MASSSSNRNAYIIDPKEVVRALLVDYLPNGFKSVKNEDSALYGSISTASRLNSGPKAKYTGKKGYYVPGTNQVNTIVFRLKTDSGGRVQIPIDIKYDMISADDEARGVLLNLYKYLLGTRHDITLKPETIFRILPKGLVNHSYNRDYYNYKPEFNLNVEAPHIWIKSKFMDNAVKRGIVRVERENGPTVYKHLYEEIVKKVENGESESQIKKFIDAIESAIINQKMPLFEAQKILIINKLAKQRFDSGGSSAAYGSSSSSSSSYAPNAVEPTSTSGPSLSAFGTGQANSSSYSTSAAPGTLFGEPIDEELVQRALSYPNAYETRNEVLNNIRGRGAAAVRGSLNTFEAGLRTTRRNTGNFSGVQSFGYPNQGPVNMKLDGGRRRRGTRKGRKARRFTKRRN